MCGVGAPTSQLRFPAAMLALQCWCVEVGGVIPLCSVGTTDLKDENCFLPSGPSPGKLQENCMAGAA